MVSKWQTDLSKNAHSSYSLSKQFIPSVLLALRCTLMDNKQCNSYSQPPASPLNATSAPIPVPSRPTPQRGTASTDVWEAYLIQATATNKAKEEVLILKKQLLLKQLGN